MSRLNGRLFQLTSLSALVFQQTVILLLLTDSCAGWAGPSRTVVGLVGDDVVLPCQVEPALDAVSRSVEWGRPDLVPRFVHVWHEAQNLLVNQNPSYKGRTSLSVEKLKRGELSLHLSAVKLSDNGKYRCYFPSQSKESTVELIVGSVSSPVIGGTKFNSSFTDLHCESEGWYPEPEVSWLDSEGHVLSAGPPETVRGPDDLYTVSSRLTVDKRHGSSFTCRVQQKTINQIREINISADYVEATTSSFPAARVSITVVVVLIFSLTAAFILWKWRRNQTSGMKKVSSKDPEADSEDTEGRQLMEERRKMEEKKAKLEEELQRKEEEQKDLELGLQILKEHNEELKNQREQVQQQKENQEETLRDIENQIKSVEKIPEDERYHEMQSITLAAKRKLKERQREDENLLLQTQKLQTKTEGLLDKMTERKKEAEKQKEEIKEQLEEIQRKLQET